MQVSQYVPPNAEAWFPSFVSSVGSDYHLKNKIVNGSLKNQIHLQSTNISKHKMHVILFYSFYVYAWIFFFDSFLMFICSSCILFLLYYVILFISSCPLLFCSSVLKAQNTVDKQSHLKTWGSRRKKRRAVDIQKVFASHYLE